MSKINARGQFSRPCETNNGCFDAAMGLLCCTPVPWPRRFDAASQTSRAESTRPGRITGWLVWRGDACLAVAYVPAKRGAEARRPSSGVSTPAGWWCNRHAHARWEMVTQGAAGLWRSWPGRVFGCSVVWLCTALGAGSHFSSSQHDKRLARSQQLGPRSKMNASHPRSGGRRASGRAVRRMANEPALECWSQRETVVATKRSLFRVSRLDVQ